MASPECSADSSQKYTADQPNPPGASCAPIPGPRCSTSCCYPGGWPPPPGGWAPPPGWGAPQWGPHPGYGQPPVYGWQPQPMLRGSGRFRAQGVGQLLDAAFTLYRRNLGMILAITAVVQVPLAVFTFLVYQFTGIASTSDRIQQLSARGVLTPQQISDLGSSLITLFAVAFVLVLVQFLVVQPIATAAMTRAVGDVYLDRAATVGGAYRAVASRIGAVVGVSALLFLTGIGIFAVFFGLLFVSAFALGQSGLALLILIVPAVIVAFILVYTRWLFAAPIVILEQKGAVDALRRSWSLVRGSTLRVFGITLLVGLITGILGGIIVGILSVVTQFGDVTLRLILNQFAALVVAVLIQPISFIVVVLLYYDLRIRREAFDIEMLAAGL